MPCEGLLDYVSPVGLSGAFTAGAAERETAGIGAALKLDGDQVIVQKILPDSPVAGLKNIAVGDRIVAVGHENESPVTVKGLPLNKVVELVRGPRGSTVRLTIVPVGKDESQARVISLTRGELKELARWGDGHRLGAGTQAPDIALTRLSDKQPERLADHRGKIIVLEFWATWCGPCVKQIGRLQEDARQHPEWKDKVVLIAASADDDADTAARHVVTAKWDQTHNVWIAPETLKAYHVDGLPSIYIIDRKGNVAANDGTESIVDAVNRLIKVED